MGEPITEASGRFGGATCKIVVSEPCRETRRRSAQNQRTPAAVGHAPPSDPQRPFGPPPQNHESRSGRGQRREGQE